MSGEVDDTILALRALLGAETDADLARKLRIDKSTVSSWRSRDRVPARFKSILNGGSHEVVATPPVRWGEHEDKAFELALFRFTRLLGSTAKSGSYRSVMELFSSRATMLWFMVTEAQRDLMAMQNNGEHDISTAFALALHDDVASPKETMNRDLERLEGHYRGLFEDSFFRHLREAQEL